MLYQKLIYKDVPIEKFSHDGRGIARIEGKTTFVFGAIPGEIVDLECFQQKKHFNEARAVKITSPSPLRVLPHCIHYETCGGCSFQHVDSDAQLKIKQTLLLDILRRVGHITPSQVLPMLKKEAWGYRHKVRLSLEWNEQGLLLGFKERDNPGAIVDVTSCPVLEHRLNALINPLKQLLYKLPLSRTVNSVEMAAGTDMISLTLPIFPDKVSAEEKNMLESFSKQHECMVLFKRMPPMVENRSEDDTQDNMSVLNYAFPKHNIIFDFLPSDFTQIHVAMNQAMIELAIRLFDLKPDETLLDLFCGMGNFSLPLSRHCLHVIGIEGHDLAVSRAKSNAQKNGCVNTTFYKADLNKKGALVLDRLIDKVLIDPPRTGALTVVSEIEHVAPQLIIYISCNPATLARDGNILIKDKGYVLKSVGVMDMFPQTAHVETIAVFEKGKSHGKSQR